MKWSVTCRDCGSDVIFDGSEVVPACPDSWVNPGEGYEAGGRPVTCPVCGSRRSRSIPVREDAADRAPKDERRQQRAAVAALAGYFATARERLTVERPEQAPGPSAREQRRAERSMSERGPRAGALPDSRRKPSKPQPVNPPGRDADKSKGKAS